MGNLRAALLVLSVAVACITTCASGKAEKIESYSSIAALRQNTSEASGGVILQSYYADRTAGGGVLTFDPRDKSTPDDGCHIFVDAIGQRFRRIFDGDVYVTYCGAKTDGSTDDTLAIASAITVAGKMGRAVHLGFGTTVISRTLNIPRQVGLIGYGRGWSKIIPRGAFRMLQWTTGLPGYDAFGVLRDFMIDGIGEATEGILIAGTEDARLQNVMVNNINGRALVLHALQNGRFDQVELARSRVLLFLTNGAWNNIFTRLELHAPSDGGYHLLSQNDPTYVRITGIPATLGLSQFNQYFGILFEGGRPTSVISLQDDYGNNYFSSGEISAASSSAQVFLSATSNNNYFGAGIFIQKVGNPTYAIEDRGYGNVFDQSIINSWSGPYAKVRPPPHHERLRGGVGPRGIETYKDQ